MKSILTITVLSALMSMTSAFAADAPAASPVSAVWAQRSVSIYQNWFNEYYSCGGIEPYITAMLEKFGARNIELTCTGGLPYWDSISVEAKFLAATPSTGADKENASFQPVKIKGRGACEMHQGVLRQLLPSFTTQNLKGNYLCGSPADSYNIEVEVLK